MGGRVWLGPVGRTPPARLWTAVGRLWGHLARPANCRRQIPLAFCRGGGRFPAPKEGRLCLPSGSAGSLLGKATSTTNYWNTVKQTNKQTNLADRLWVGCGSAVAVGGSASFFPRIGTEKGFFARKKKRTEAGEREVKNWNESQPQVRIAKLVLSYNTNKKIFTLPYSRNNFPYTYMSGWDHSASLSVGHRCLGTQVPDRGLAEVLTSPNKINTRRSVLFCFVLFDLQLSVCLCWLLGTAAGTIPTRR